ncbi:MAG: metallophosphoesterase [Lachnospiraceae bacterium]|nr:metallophosphoesterase [Lachnospiraceae bacterium]MDE6627445.1 metallophosphoesterase [Lachnospiraceae bacterium]
MKILVLADEESKYLWDYFEKKKLEGIDLIISCGDLKPQYLSFLATYSKAPVLYVHGNHDAAYKTTPPEGCICIDDRIYVHNGIRIMGLGGSKKYNYGAFQYSEREMRSRVHKLCLKLLRHKGFDILVTHAPAYQFNDGEDLPHSGFQVFRELLDKYKPKFFLHGHVHLSYSWNQQRECMYNEYTTVINGFERYVFEYKQ